MHIPDGFLDVKTAVATGAIAACGLGIALRQTRLALPARRIPLLGLGAAFVFAAQMINFPVAAGTSGHLMGGALIGALLGPGAAVVVLAAVLIVQCFMFADGGISALGANILNMGLIGGAGGWAIFALLRPLSSNITFRACAAGFAAWVVTVLSAIVCAGQLATSKTVAFHIAAPAMAGIHTLIGIGEGIITAMVYLAIARARQDLVEPQPAPATGSSQAPLVAYGLLVALAIAMFASPFASSWPDGLEHVAEQIGFAGRAADPAPAPMPDYTIPGISGAITTSLAGAIGTILLFAAAIIAAKLLTPSRHVIADKP